MQRLLDAVGLKNDDDVDNGEKGQDVSAVNGKSSDAALSSDQATQDPDPGTTQSKSETTSPSDSNEPQTSAFVVVSDPEGEDTFDVYPAEQLGESTAMASSSKLPNGAPEMNWPPSENEMKGRDGPAVSTLKSSRSYSVASAAADKSRREPLRADNPGSIPTAGGQAIGGRATQEREVRRRSRMSVDMGKPSSRDGKLALDKEGSPDPLTQNNTQANTVPARMNADNGEGSSKVEPEPGLERRKSPSAPEVTPLPQTTEDAASPETGNDVKTSKDVEDSAPAAAKPTTNAATPKGRRPSTLDNMLGKLKLGKKKN